VCLRVNLTSKRSLLLKGVGVVRRTLFGLNSARIQRTWQGRISEKTVTQAFCPCPRQNRQNLAVSPKWAKSTPLSVFFRNEAEEVVWFLVTFCFLPRRKSHLLPGYILERYQTEKMRDAVQACPSLIIGIDDMPWRLGSVCGGKHQHRRCIGNLVEGSATVHSPSCGAPRTVIRNSGSGTLRLLASGQMRLAPTEFSGLRRFFAR
jgi:hypothetical protein